MVEKQTDIQFHSISMISFHPPIHSRAWCNRHQSDARVWIHSVSVRRHLGRAHQSGSCGLCQDEDSHKNGTRKGRKMSSNRTTILNKEWGSYCFTMQIKCQTNSCLALDSLWLSLFEEISGGNGAAVNPWPFACICDFQAWSTGAFSFYNLYLLINADYFEGSFGVPAAASEIPYYPY